LPAIQLTTTQRNANVKSAKGLEIFFPAAMTLYSNYFSQICVMASYV
jgi:hypothetical protein